MDGSNGQALRLLLRHSCIRETRSLLCRLLATSRHLQVAVRESCSSSIQLQYSPPTQQYGESPQHLQRQYMQQWLNRYCWLVKDLEVTISIDTPFAVKQLQQVLVQHGDLLSQLVVWVVAVQLPAAELALAAGAAGLKQLKSFTTNYATPGILQSSE